MGNYKKVHFCLKGASDLHEVYCGRPAMGRAMKRRESLVKELTKSSSGARLGWLRYRGSC